MKIVVFACLLAVSVAAPGPEQRIVQGTAVGLFSHPHQASLQIQENGSWRHICGCVVIHTEKILTAAHCLQGQTASTLRVKVGALKLDAAPNEYEQTVGVASYVIHEGYKATDPGIPNDIGIMYLLSPLILNPNVQIASLAPKGSSFANKKCVITGWGLTSGTGQVSQDLLEAKMTQISTLECQLRWLLQNVNIKHICVYEASAASGSRPSACAGDSGGPMMCGDNLEFLAGITSWGVTTCSGNYPSVYTRVSEYLDWIRSK